jgi:hypothetical protein
MDCLNIRDHVYEGSIDVDLYEVIDFFNSFDLLKIAEKIRHHVFLALNCYEVISDEALEIYGPAIGIYYNISEEKDQELMGYMDLFVSCLRAKGVQEDKISKWIFPYKYNTINHKGTEEIAPDNNPLEDEGK